MNDTVRKIVIFVSSGGYVGFASVASGTFGTMVGIPLYLLMYHFLPNAADYMALLLLLSFGGAWVSDKAEIICGVPDSSKIVIDEIIGFLWGMFLIPPTYISILLGFFVFRVMDVLKPPPLERLEKVHGGWGVMLDDIGAGIYTCLILHILRALLGSKLTW